MISIQTMKRAVSMEKVTDRNYDRILVLISARWHEEKVLRKLGLAAGRVYWGFALGRCGPSPRVQFLTLTTMVDYTELTRTEVLEALRELQEVGLVVVKLFMLPRDWAAEILHYMSMEMSSALETMTLDGSDERSGN